MNHLDRSHSYTVSMLNFTCLRPLKIWGVRRLGTCLRLGSGFDRKHGVFFTKEAGDLISYGSNIMGYDMQHDVTSYVNYVIWVWSPNSSTLWPCLAGTRIVTSLASFIFGCLVWCNTPAMIFRLRLAGSVLNLGFRIRTQIPDSHDWS